MNDNDKEQHLAAEEYDAVVVADDDPAEQERICNEVISILRDKHRFPARQRKRKTHKKKQTGHLLNHGLFVVSI